MIQARFCLIELYQAYISIEFVESVIVYALDFENDRTAAVITAGDHSILIAHPAFHYRTALQASIDISGYGIPHFGTERFLWSSGYLVGVPFVFTSVFRPQCQ